MNPPPHNHFNHISYKDLRKKYIRDVLQNYTENRCALTFSGLCSMLHTSGQTMRKLLAEMGDVEQITVVMSETKSMLVLRMKERGVA